MFGTKERDLIPINEHPRVVAARAKTQAARAEADTHAADEQRLRSYLDPTAESSTTTLKEITPEMLAESNRRLIPRRFGVTDCRYADTAEGNAARVTLSVAMAEETQVREQVRRELEQAVKARAADLLDELETALKPCRTVAGELSALRADTEIAVPPGLSHYALGLIENELRELKQFVKS